MGGLPDHGETCKMAIVGKAAVSYGKSGRGDTAGWRHRIAAAEKEAVRAEFGTVAFGARQRAVSEEAVMDCLRILEGIIRE